MIKNPQKILFITASSRKKGNTLQVMEHLCQHFDGELLDLSESDISYYDYEHRNEQDDFLAIAEKMCEASLIVLGSPVYWYSISAQMKTFIDRWSDLLTIRKDLGRKLRSRQLILISCGSWEEAGEGFDLPLRQTAEYMDMDFTGYFHTWLADNEGFYDEPVQERVSQLVLKLEELVWTS
jgi:NAD(P)H-dependent FMN reductase